MYDGKLKSAFEDGEMERFLLPRARALARAYRKTIPARTRVANPAQAEELLDRLERLTGEALSLFGDENGGYHLVHSREIIPCYSCYIFPVGGIRSLRNKAAGLLTGFLKRFFRQQGITAMDDMDYIIDRCTEIYSDTEMDDDDRLDSLRTIDLCEDYTSGERAAILALEGEFNAKDLEEFVPENITEEKMISLIKEGLGLMESGLTVIGQSASCHEWQTDDNVYENCLYIDQVIRFTVDVEDSVTQWVIGDMESYINGGICLEAVLVSEEVAPKAAKDLTREETAVVWLLKYYEKLTAFLYDLPVSLEDPPESAESASLKRQYPCHIQTSEKGSTTAGGPAPRS